MTSPYEESPESLHLLRLLVHDWLRKAAEAVETFYDHKHRSFWRDSRKAADVRKQSGDYNLSATTTARCYMALAYADRCLPDVAEENVKKWIKRFSEFASGNHTERNGVVLYPWDQDPTYIRADGDDRPLNNFEVAHLADFVFFGNYVGRFHAALDTDGGCVIKVPGIGSGTGCQLVEKLDELLKKEFGDEAASQPAHGLRDEPELWKGGQLAFENLRAFSPKNNELDRWSGHHFFVTLHTLRAMAILDGKAQMSEAAAGRLPGMMRDARALCIEQCYYVHRGASHHLDPASLTFATVLYSLYGKNVEADLCSAAVESLAKMQRDNGSWPATHPIIRGKNLPWFISSHELALCLTWLYFQPRVPDSARGTLLSMMEMYFRNWVIPTYLHVLTDKHRGSENGADTTTELATSGGPQISENDSAADDAPGDDTVPDMFKGWFDDHMTGADTAVGWATAIVCHFLANYYWVLSDHINRRVIQSLGLESSKTMYLIDATAYNRSRRWSRRWDPFGSNSARISTWPDLPPFAWRDYEGPEDVARRIRWHWTDPSAPNGGEAGHSMHLASKVLDPILKDSGGRPARDRVAGILPGQPGTRKTTLVETLARYLEWPLVTVPASTIFADGFDLMETRATDVFRRLRYLTGCVLFFDEFEEFFRDRREGPPASGDAPPVHNRTIAAFTTSAMLPRLQELHDERRCLVFFATNYPEKVDAAIRRRGRFDFKLEIGHPNRAAILAFLESPTKAKLKKLGLKTNERECKVQDEEPYQTLSTAVSGAVKTLLWRSEQLRFSTVEEVLDEVKKEFDKGNDAERELRKTAVKSLTELRERHGKPGRDPDAPELEEEN